MSDLAFRVAFTVPPRFSQAIDNFEHDNSAKEGLKRLLNSPRYLLSVDSEVLAAHVAAVAWRTPDHNKSLSYLIKFLCETPSFQAAAEDAFHLLNGYRQLVSDPEATKWFQGIVTRAALTHLPAQDRPPEFDLDAFAAEILSAQRPEVRHER